MLLLEGNRRIELFKAFFKNFILCYVLCRNKCPNAIERFYYTRKPHHLWGRLLLKYRCVWQERIEGEGSCGWVCISTKSSRIGWIYSWSVRQSECEKNEVYCFTSSRSSWADFLWSGLVLRFNVVSSFFARPFTTLVSWSFYARLFIVSVRLTNSLWVIRRKHCSA